MTVFKSPMGIPMAMIEAKKREILAREGKKSKIDKIGKKIDLAVNDLNGKTASSLPHTVTNFQVKLLRKECVSTTLIPGGFLSSATQVGIEVDLIQSESAGTNFITTFFPDRLF